MSPNLHKVGLIFGDDRNKGSQPYVLSKTGYTTWCPPMVSPVVSSTRYTMWCPQLGTPCGVPLWCPQPSTPRGVPNQVHHVVSPCGVPRGVLCGVPRYTMWCPLWCPPWCPLWCTQVHHVVSPRGVLVVSPGYTTPWCTFQPNLIPKSCDQSSQPITSLHSLKSPRCSEKL